MKFFWSCLLSYSLVCAVHGTEDQIILPSGAGAVKEAVVRWGADKGEEYLRANLVTFGVMLFRCSGFFIAPRAFVSSARCANMFDTRRDAEFLVGGYGGRSFSLSRVLAVSEEDDLGILETEEAYLGEVPVLDVSLYSGIVFYVMGYNTRLLGFYQGRRSLFADEVVDFEPSYHPGLTKNALEGSPVLNGDGKIVGVFRDQQWRGTGWDYVGDYALAFTPAEALVRLASGAGVPLRVDRGWRRGTGL